MIISYYPIHFFLTPDFLSDTHHRPEGSPHRVSGSIRPAPRCTAWDLLPPAVPTPDRCYGVFQCSWDFWRWCFGEYCSIFCTWNRETRICPLFWTINRPFMGQNLQNLMADLSSRYRLPTMVTMGFVFLMIVILWIFYHKTLGKFRDRNIMGLIVIIGVLMK